MSSMVIFLALCLIRATYTRTACAGHVVVDACLPMVRKDKRKDRVEVDEMQMMAAFPIIERMNTEREQRAQLRAADGESSQVN